MPGTRPCQLVHPMPRSIDQLRPCPYKRAASGPVLDGRLAVICGVAPWNGPDCQNPRSIPAKTAHPEAFDETDLSTQPTGAQASARFSGQNGDPGRSQGYCRSQSSRTQAAFGLNGRDCPALTGAVILDRLRSRSDYLATAKGARAFRPSFVLQARRREDAAAPRFGFTVTRKVGNAVLRNRVRRRLKEIARLGAADAADGMDYVLIGRADAANQPFAAMAADFSSALRAVVKGRPQRDGAH